MSLTTAVFIVIGTQATLLILSEKYQERRHKESLESIERLRVTLQNELFQHRK